jgi:hypothetical protein
MQDNSSGFMYPIEADTQEAKDAVLARERQGAVFFVGEELNIKGGRFAVKSIGKEFIVLRGLPGTDHTEVSPITAKERVAHFEEALRDIPRRKVEDILSQFGGPMAKHLENRDEFGNATD